MELSRRGFIRLAGASAGAVLLIEACNSPAPAARPPLGSGATGATGPLPTYLAQANGPKPEFHSADPRITDGFNNFPRSPIKSWSAGAPSSGGTLNVLVPAYYPVPTPRDSNATWKAIEKELGTVVNMTIVPTADYPSRIQVVMAGNDLPDIIHVINTVSSLIGDQFVQAQASDLTPYLSGDAARDYPNLAAIPGYAYRGAGGIFANRLYGVPIHRYLPAFWFFRNTDIWDAEIGASTVPRDAEDFKKILQQLNRPRENRYAIGNVGPTGATGWGIVSFLEMFGAPNVWARDGSGKLVRDRETEAYKAALGYMKDLLAAGLYPPDVQTSGDSRGQFLAGKFVVSNEAFGNGWNDMWRRGLQQTPPRHFAIVAPFNAVAGAQPVHFLTAGVVAYNLVRKSSPDRVKEILRVMNYLAAPFGSIEDLLLTYGLQDQDYAMDAAGNPSPTPAGTLNSSYVPWQYVAHRPYVWYQADLPGYAQAAFETEQVLVNVGVTDPTRGYHSATQSRKGVAADQTFYDGVADILFNRRPFSDYDALVNDWRSAVGDAIRAEFLTEIDAR